RGALAMEDARIRVGRAAEVVAQTPPGARRRRRRRRGQDREADVLEGAGDQARAHHLGRQPASEIERATPEAARDETHRKEIAREVEQVLQVVARAELRDHLVEDALQVVALQAVRPADADVEGRVFRERRGDDPLLQGLDDQVLGILTVRPHQLLAPRREPPHALSFRRRLLAWYARHGRRLPWRGLADPYAVLVSEIMLQQTQVARVAEFFPRFLARYPTLEELAATPSDAVREAWNGLGYYARARNLHAAARHVVDRLGGVLPERSGDLRRLPGIGRYTAGAVASIVFGANVAALDT